MAIISNRKNKMSDIVAFYNEVNSREEDVSVAEFLDMLVAKFNLSSPQRARDYFYRIRKMTEDKAAEEKPEAEKVKKK